MSVVFSPLPPEDLAHICEHTRDLWEEARGKRFFITGGTGFFGVWLLESFLHINAQLGLDASVLALTRDVDAFLAKHPHLKDRAGLSFHQGDVRTFDFPDGEFAYVVHAATEASEKLNSQNPLVMLDTCIEGTRHTLDFAVSRKCQKLSGYKLGRSLRDATRRTGADSRGLHGRPRSSKSRSRLR